MSLACGEIVGGEVVGWVRFGPGGGVVDAMMVVVGFDVQSEERMV